MKKKKIEEKKCLIFFLELFFFLTILNTAVLGSEIVSSAICAAVDESLVSNQYGYLGGIITGNRYRRILLRRDFN